MAFLTTNPSPFIINVPELQNVLTSATGTAGTSGLTNTVNDILTLVNTANSQLNINTIGSSTSGSVTFTSNINLSNSEITFLGSNLLGSNTLNGPAGYLAFQVNGTEYARLTTTGFGIGTTAPAVALDVAGSGRVSGSLSINSPIPASLPLDVTGGAVIRGPLYVSSFHTNISSVTIAGGAQITGNVGINAQLPQTLPLDVTGGAIIRGPFFVSSYTTELSSLSVSGGAEITGNVGINAVLPTSLPLDVTGGAIIRGPFFVSSYTTELSSLTINGQTQISGNLSVNAQLPQQFSVDISGGALVYGPLYVSSYGLVSAQTGNIIASGDIFANGVFYPSDPALKTNIRTYTSPGLPTPVEFAWRRDGARDIGVLADEVARLEPACVIRSPSGGLTVDYAKLSVILLAEIHTLKAQMSTLTARLT